MPGPFPGMDPYLESADYWRGVHTRFMAHLADGLNAALPPNYVTDLDARLYVERSDRSVYPNAAVLMPPAPVEKPAWGGGAALLETPAWTITVEEAPLREAYVEIRRVGNEQVVTAIEVLSPANKAAGSDGRRLYREKQRELLDSDVHLIEIDLLRTGAHTAAPPEGVLRGEGRWDYLVSLHRAGWGGEFLVWPVGVRDRLPVIRVPLADDDPDLLFDLQAVFDTVYDAGGYARRGLYAGPPAPPLSMEDAAWADALLREKGLRP